MQLNMGPGTPRYSERASGPTDWIDMARDRDRRWAFLNAVMNIRVP